jgi:signal transduction histidine kinase/ligand-binding sensor domain-containing protein
VQCIIEDAQGSLWIGTEGNGLNRFDVLEKKFTSYRHKPKEANSLSSDNITGLVEDERGILWITTTQGLTLLDKKGMRFTQHHPVVGDPQSLRADNLMCIRKDQEGIIWIGSSDGLHKYNPRIDFFSHYTHDPQNKNSLSHKAVWPVYEDKEGIVWIGTWGGGLNRFDRRTNQWTHYRHNPNNPSSISHDQLSHLIEDRTGKLWMTTGAALDCMDKRTGKFTHYKPNDADPKSLHGGTAVHEVMEDRNGAIWVTTYQGLNKLDVKTGTFRHFRHDPADSTTISSDAPSCIKEAKNGDFLIGTFGKGLNIYNPKTNHFRRFMHREGDSTSLNNSDVYCTYEDQKGNIWIGGITGIDYLDPVSGKVTHYREKDGLPNETIYRIEADGKGRLWISTNKGIARLDPRTGQIKNFDIADGLQSQEFNGYGSGQSKRTGELFFGGVNGFNIFHPDSIRDDPYKPVVLISKMRRYGKDARSVEESMLGKHAIVLPHDENLMTFEFLSLSLSKPLKNQYVYQLKGFSDQWYYLGTQREITFTGLAPGRYTLRVKGSNGDGIWNDSPAVLTLTVLPPWWRSWWAYAFYGLCLLAGAYAVHRYQRQRVINKERERARERELEQARTIEKAYHELKATQTQLIQSEKMASLGELTAGIAHEIQNPLNFVNNFSETNAELLSELKEEIDNDNKREALAIADDLIANEQKILYHGKRADSIVKNMLQHSRTSKGEKQLTDINALVDEYLRLSYHGMRAKDKSFNATINTDFDDTIRNINIVPQDVGRVLLNLFNNAFYTVHERLKNLGEGYQPKVWVSTKQLDEQIKIQVQDNGMGIPKSVQDKIFQPFFTTKPTGQGTGLGLSLSYDIVKAHNGEIKVDSKEGEGTTFIMQLPT